MRTADCLARGHSSIEEARERASYFDVCMAQVSGEGYAGAMREVRPTIRLLDYIQPTYRDRWNLGITRDLPGETFVDYSDPFTRSLLASRAGDYLDVRNLDGLLLDTPFEIAPGTEREVFRAYVDIGLEMRARGMILVANFGDLFTWANRRNWLVAQTAALCDWHFVQVAMDMMRFTLARFALLVSETTKRLAEGKTVIIGIHDPHRMGLSLPRDIANALVKLNPERVYIYYQTHAHTDGPVTDWRME